MGSYAIVGLSCLFPGAATPDAYWRNLMDGADSRTEGGERIFGHDPLAPGPGAREDRDRHRIYCTRGGFLGTEAETAVPDGLLLPAGYLAGLDRSFHWALRTAHDALADAGVSPAAASGGAEGRRTGVVFGNYPFPTPASGRTAGKLWDAAVTEGLAAAGFPEAGLPFLTENGSPAMTADGSEAGERGAAGGPAAAPAAHLAEAHNLWPGGLPAHVVAAALGLGGPRFTLDAACSSALYALELACAQLATGRADLMLAGGVCAPDPTVIHLSFSDLRAYPPDGAPSQPFDARSRGIITGQGAAMVAVKRLADARRDGDRVLAVIEGIGLGNDGPGKHLLVPNVNGQLASYDLAYRRAGVDPGSVRYVECHATGTPIGDRTELEGVERYFGRGPLLGSVKGNIGHLLTAAGMSSLVKVVLALGHGILPPTAGLRQPLPGTVADRVVRAPVPWPAGDGVRRAAVSAFGFGGTNAHVVLSGPETAPEEEPEEPRPAPPPMAVIGMGAHFGSLTTLDAFERAGYDGTNVVRELPAHRWRGFETGPLPGGARDAAYVAQFEADATAYRIPPNDLDHFNQQHLLMMRVAEEALRDAGYERGAPGGTGRRVAVVLGMEMEPSAHGHAARHALGRKLAAWCARAGLDPSDEQLAALTRAARDGIHDSIEANEVLSYIGNIMAARISSLWNLTGPSFTVSSDSSVGADALDAARLLLLDPSVEAVLVGAVDLAAGPESTLARDLLEPGGAPLLGEGAGAVVVTRPGSVPPDRTVYATVDALAVRHSATLSPRPDPGLVAAAAEEALAAAGVTAADVELVETGTTDPAALTGLTRVWSATRAGGALRTALSAAGAAVGDTGCASVLASLIRAALCLHHAYQPVAPDGVDRDALDGSGFFLAADSRPWPRRRRDGRRLACVSVTGTAGSHAHLVLGGAQTRGEVAATDWTRSGGSLVVPVGADDLDGLLRRLTELRDTVADGGDWDRLAQDRPAALKAVLVADDPAGLVRQAEQALKDLPGVHRAGGEWTSPSGSCFAARPAGGPGVKTALVYPGAFNSYLGLGRALFRAFPGLLPRFEAQAEAPAAMLRSEALYPRSLGPLDRRDLMRRETALLDDIPLMLAVGTSYALLATDLVRDVLGVPVHGAFGYSLGESSMLFATGGWSKGARATAKIDASSLFVDRLRGPKKTVRALWGLGDDVPDAQVWATHVLLAPADEVRAALAGYDRVFITHVNTPHEVVVAGDPAQCRALIDALGCQSARSPANHVMHCPVVDGVLPELADLNRYPTGDTGGLVLYSSRHYAPVDDLDPDRVARNIAVTLRETVDFPRLVRRAYDDGFRCFIEVGPSSTCTRWIHETLGDEPHLSVPVDRRGARGATDIARLAARLAAHGVPVDLTPFRRRTTLSRRPPGLRTFPVGGTPVAPLVAEAAAPVLARIPRTPPARTRADTGAQALPATAGATALRPEAPLPAAAREDTGAVPVPAGAGAALAAGGAPGAAEQPSAVPAPAPVPPREPVPVTVPARASGPVPASGPGPAAGAGGSAAEPSPPPPSPAPVPAGARPSGPAHDLPAPRPTATEWDTAMPTRPAGPPVPALALERDPITMLPAEAVRTAPSPPGPPAPAPAPAPEAAPSPAPGPESASAPAPAESVPAPRPPADADTPAVPPRPAVFGAPLPVPPRPARGSAERESTLALVRSLRAEILEAHREVLDAQRTLRDELLAVLTAPAATAPAATAPAATAPAATAPPVQPPAPPAPPRAPKPEGVVWDEQDLLEFATGKIGNVFGPRYARIDGYARRVRLPAPPYLFATRVTQLDAEPGEFRPSFIRTEYDVPEDAWYAVDGQVPPAVTIEAGQCDLLLISYLGADFTNRGRRVYRLLDSTLSFVGDLPRTGQTLRYDIWIDQFVRQGDTLLFFFHYDCYADGELILKLTNACAGFFTDEELEASPGLVQGRAARAQAPAEKRSFKPPARTERTSLTTTDLDALAEGRIADVFGEGHRQPPGCNPSLRLPDGPLRMADEVTVLDRTGGRHGLGRIEAVKRLDPDGWYFTSHFPDDPVLAGSLVAEGAVQLLEVYALSLGLHLTLPDARFQPVPDLTTEVKVRGQITPRTERVEYRIDITELTLLPRPALVADVVVLRDGTPSISVTGLGIRLREKPGTPYRPEAGGEVPHFLGRLSPATGEPALLNEFHMAHAAKGDLAVAMGPEFEIYANSRAPYIPNGDFLFVDRVMRLDGTRGTLRPGAVMVTEYDVPEDAWYYADNGHPYMPNCVYMESSLQAAILLGYYLGATLPFPEERFSIRNLDGRATLLKDLDLRGRTVQHRSTLLSSDRMPGSILQNFAYELSCDDEVFYTGESLFGYFNEKALARQVGLDKGQSVPPWLDARPARPPGTRRIGLPAFRERTAGTAPRPAGGHLDLVEWLDVLPGGGEHGQGYLRGHRTIRPDEWYFSCHFHRDPVMPGSLGVEALLQGLQVYAVETGLTEGLRNPRFALLRGTETTWSYRGQILRDDPDMEFDVHIKEVRREPGRIVITGDGHVWKSDLRIYRLGDLGIEIHHD